MNIVTRKHLMQAAETYPDAARELLAWRKIVLPAHWRSFMDVRRVFPDADAVDEFVIFNLRQNRYRLVTVIHYSKYRGDWIAEGHIHIHAFLTHEEYDLESSWNRGA